MDIIQIENLHKSFGEVKAADDVAFSVQEGSLFAFLGINGAGKSTTINIIATLRGKDSGRVNVAGYDLDKDQNAIRRSIGVVFQNSILDKTLSVGDNPGIRAAQPVRPAIFIRVPIHFTSRYYLDKTEHHYSCNRMETGENLTFPVMDGD